MRALIEKRNALRDEFKVAENAYYEYEREQRRMRQEKAMQEREAWAEEKKKADRQKKVERLDDQPYTAEIALVEQTTKFCKSFLPKEEKTVEDKKEIKHDNPDTHMVLASKKDREEEFYFAPTKKGKTKLGSGKKGGGSGKQQIKHNAETFKLFKALGLEAPLATDDIAPLLEELDAKMKHYQDKIAEWESNREEMKRRILAGEESDEEPQKDGTPAAEEE